MLLKKTPGWVVSSEGYEVVFEGRHHIKYIDGESDILIETEHGGGVLPIYKQSIRNRGGDPVKSEMALVVLSRVDSAMKFLGKKTEIK